MLISPDQETIEIYARYSALLKRMAKLNAELDKLRVIIRDKGI